MKGKGKVKRILSLALMAAGVAIFLFPDIMSLVQTVASNNYIRQFEEYYGVEETEDEAEDTGEEDTEMPYAELYEAIVRYNQEIYESGQEDFRDAWSYVQSPVDIDCLENELFGYIEVPSMGVKMPLYIGASVSNMAKGAAIMGQTSIPIGGTNTNSVIAGHRGYGGSPYFRYITDVELGDYVYITNPWETLTYQAVDIQVINPYDSDAVKIQEGKELVTLLTCHPYASGGKYRYLVFCERVEDDTQDAESLPDNYEEINEQLREEYAWDASAMETLLRRTGAAAILVLILITAVRGRKRQKKGN